MECRRSARIFLIAFLLGAAIPFLLSIYAMLWSFDTGTSLAPILAPAILMADNWPGYMITVANGLLYGFAGLGIALLLRRKRQ